MPLQRRLPKIGFRSKIAPLVAEVRLHELALVAGGVVDLDALKKAGRRAGERRDAPASCVGRDQDRRDREGRRRHHGCARGDRSRGRQGRGGLSGPTGEGHSVANPPSSNPIAALGEATPVRRSPAALAVLDRRADRLSHRHVHPGARHRPGGAGAVLPGAAGHDPEHVQHVLGRRAAAAVDLRARHHAVHLGVDHRADEARRDSAAAGSCARKASPAAARSRSTRATARSALAAVPGRRRRRSRCRTRASC